MPELTEHTQPYTPTFATDEFPAVAEPSPPAPPVAVPGTLPYLKRWTFVLVVAGVWVLGAAIGAGLYYWWFHELDKTAPVFTLLVFLVVTSVGAVMTAMVANRPLVSALSIGLMSAPLAATAAAAVVHGTYFCDRVSRCLVGVIPY